MCCSNQLLAHSSQLSKIKDNAVLLYNALIDGIRCLELDDEELLINFQ